MAVELNHIVHIVSVIKRNFFINNYKIFEILIGFS